MPLEDVTNYSADQLVFPYKVYELQTSYKYNSGMLQLPIAAVSATASTATNPLLTPLATSSDNGVPNEDIALREPCVTVKVSEPYGRKIVTFRAVRQGVPPVVPDPTPISPYEVLLSADFDLKAPRLINNGQCYEWEAVGQMVYLLTAPYWISDGLTGGSTPVDVSSQASNYLPYPQMYDAELPGVPAALSSEPVEMTTLLDLID